MWQTSSGSERVVFWGGVVGVVLLPPLPLPLRVGQTVRS